MAPNSRLHIVIAGYALLTILSAVNSQEGDFGMSELLETGTGRKPIPVDPSNHDDLFNTPTEHKPKPDINVIGSCGGKYFENQGRIASPQFPTNNYPEDTNCTWEIWVPAGKQIKLMFEYMDIEVGPPECPFDGVMLIDYGEMWGTGVIADINGPVAEGIKEPQVSPTVLGQQRYCGELNEESFNTMYSISNMVRVRFYSDSDTGGGGFVLSWSAVENYCDFEEGICPGWSNVDTIEDNFDWNVGSGKTDTRNTGPDYDHTIGIGKYAFIEASTPRKENDTAILSSPEIEFAVGEISICVEFWYSMYGEQIGSLVMGLAVGNNRTMEWIKSGNQGPSWQRAAVNINRIDYPFRILFAAVRGNGYEGDIAIDDITITREQCRSEVQPTSVLAENRTNDNQAPTINYMGLCSDTKYPCMGGSPCIAEEKLCDGTVDCPEGDDESDFICASNATTALAPPAVTTDFELATATNYDAPTTDLTTIDLLTTVPSWMVNLTTFQLDLTTVGITESYTTMETATEEATTESAEQDETTAEEATIVVTTRMTTVQDETTAAETATETTTKTTKVQDETTVDEYTKPDITPEVTTYQEDTTFNPETTEEPEKTTVQDVTTIGEMTTKEQNMTTGVASTNEKTTSHRILLTTIRSTRPPVVASTTFDGVVIGPDESTTDYVTENINDYTSRSATIPSKSTTLKTTTAPMKESTHHASTAILPDITATATTGTTIPVAVTRQSEKAIPEGQFTPRPSMKSPVVPMITGKIENSTNVAEKQKDDDSSAVRISGHLQLQLLLSIFSSLVVIQWLCSGR